LAIEKARNELRRIDGPFEKTRMVVQGYQDAGKKEILMQSPTIQRSSQRILVALAPILIGNQRRTKTNKRRTQSNKEKEIKVIIRDISQAYTQSQSNLQRKILCYLPKEIVHQYPSGTLIEVIKPLWDCRIWSSLVCNLLKPSQRQAQDDQLNF
jgi:hypothetical protein